MSVFFILSSDYSFKIYIYYILVKIIIYFNLLSHHYVNNLIKVKFKNLDRLAYLEWRNCTVK